MRPLQTLPLDDLPIEPPPVADPIMSAEALAAELGKDRPDGAPRKKASKSPTQRSLEYLRKNGHTAAVVERWNVFARVRQDLFGCIDIVSLSPEGHTVGVQACALSSVAARVAKVANSEHIAALRRSGWRLVVQGWGKGADGKYRMREVDVS